MGPLPLTAPSPARASGARKRVLFGACLGGALGLITALYCQLEPRIRPFPGLAFTGFPQGLDLMNYSAYVQAILRSPTGLTYSYPFSLPGDVNPPVLFHLPFAVAAVLARLTGVPLAFEVLRVAGAAATGAALAWLVGVLFRRGPGWRRLAGWALVVGGGWFAWLGLYHAVRISGGYGISEWWEYQKFGTGPFETWAPFLLQNLFYPVECFYHGIVIGAMAALLAGRGRLALGLNAMAWLSNPFPAVAMNAGVIPWMTMRVLARSGEARREAARQLAGWGTVAVIAIGYHELFLKQWPLFAEVMRLHHVPLAAPPKPLQLFGLIGPWLPALVWSLVTPTGRRHVWLDWRWSLAGWMAVAHLALINHGWVMGERALQPYHFDRGYMHVALALVTLRAMLVLAPRAKRPPRWAVVWMALTMLDQPFWLLTQFRKGVLNGLTTPGLLSALEKSNEIPGSRLMLADYYMAAPLVAATTRHRPFLYEESIFVPWAEARGEAVRQIREGALTLAAAGVDLLLTFEDSDMTALAAEQGWTEYARFGAFRLLVSPDIVSESGRR